MVDRFEQHPPEVRVTREEYERGKQDRVLVVALAVEKIYRLRHKMPPQVGFFALQRWVKLEDVNESISSRVITLSFVSDDAEQGMELPLFPFSDEGYIHHNKPIIVGVRRKRVRGIRQIETGYLLDSLDELDRGLSGLSEQLSGDAKIPR